MNQLTAEGFCAWTAELEEARHAALLNMNCHPSTAGRPCIDWQAGFEAGCSEEALSAELLESAVAHEGLVACAADAWAAADHADQAGGSDALYATPSCEQVIQQCPSLVVSPE